MGLGVRRIGQGPLLGLMLVLLAASAGGAVPQVLAQVKPGQADTPGGAAAVGTTTASSPSTTSPAPAAASPSSLPAPTVPARVSGRTSPVGADANVFYEGSGLWTAADGQDVTPWHEPAPPSPAGAQVLTYDAVFQKDLFVQSDLDLRGISSVNTVTFTRPRTWELVSGTELRLIIEHSSALLPERSHLTIHVNDVSLASVTLSEKNVTATEVRVPLPLGLLQDYNVLRLEVQQHYTDDCEDPFDPALWTKISRDSVLHLAYRPLPVAPDLLTFPLPFFDRLGYGPTVLRLIPPASPSAQTLEALGRVSVAFGRDASYRPLAYGAPVQSVTGSRGHLILVGTPQELPAITGLVGDKLQSLPPSAGLVAMVPNPGNPYLAVLVVSGNTPEAVLLAARALASAQRHEVLSGSASVIQQLLEGKPSLPRSRNLFMPTTNGFTLKDLGVKDATVRGFYASPLRHDLRYFPDQQFFERGQIMRVHYGYGAQLDPRLSTFEIRWNGVTLQSAPLDDPRGQPSLWLDVPLPTAVFSPTSRLEFVFNLFPKGYNPCETKADKQLWGTLYADTSFFMPRYTYARMPDLGKLQHALYPFGLLQDLAETVVVLPDAPDAVSLLAGVAVAGELGRGTVAERASLRLVTASSVTPEMQASSHLILVSGPGGNAFLSRLQGKLSLSMENGDKPLLQKLLQDWRGPAKGQVLQALDPTAHGSLEQLVSPFGTEKTITILHGRNEGYLRQVLSLMFDPKRSSQLHGNLAVVSAEGDLNVLDVAEQTVFGAMPLAVSAEKIGREQLWLVLLGLLAGVGVLYILLRRWLAAYRARHHGPKSGPGGGAPAGSNPGASSPALPESSAASTGAASSSNGSGASSASAASDDSSSSGGSAGGSSPNGAPQRRLPPRRPGGQE